MATTSTSSTGFVSPQQYALAAQQSRAELQAQADVISAVSEDMVAQSQAKNQFIPGTSETAESLRVKHVGELEAQKRKQETAAATDWDNLRITLGQDLAAMAHEQRAITTKIKEDSAVSLWDDPLTALANAFTLPWDQQALEGVTGKIEVTSKAMQAINTHVQQSALSANAIKTTITEGTLAAETEAVANLFAQKTNAAKLAAAQSRSTTIEHLLRMDQHGLEAWSKNQEAADRAENRKLRRETHDRQIKEFDLRMEKFTDEKERDAMQFSLVNEALVAEGRNPIDAEGFKYYKARSGDFLDQLMHKGLLLRTQGRDNYTHGTNIEENLKWKNTLNWKPDPRKPQQTTLVSWMVKARNEAIAGATKGDKTGAALSADTIFNKRFNDGQEEITEGSIFKLPSAVVYAGSTAMLRNPIWQKYVVPTLTEASANAPMSEELVLEAATKAMLAKEVTSSQAAAFVQEVVARGVALNNTNLEFEKLAGRKQTKYGVRLSSGFVGKDTFDLMKETEVQAALQAKIVNTFGLTDVFHAVVPRTK